MSNPFLDKLVQDFVTWANDIEACRSIILYGSASRIDDHPADEYADCDIMVYATDADSEPYLDWMRDYAPLWTVIQEKETLWIIVFAGGHVVHLSVDPIETLQDHVDKQETWFRRSYQILLDKDHLAEKLPSPETPTQDVPPEAEFLKIVNSFLYGAILLMKQIKRGDLWKVKRDVGVQQRFMLQMLEWHARTLNDVDTWDRGGFMQEWVSEDTWQALHHIFAHFDADDSRRALLEMTSLFRKLAQETASHLNYTLPESVIDDVTAYIEGL